MLFIILVLNSQKITLDFFEIVIKNEKIVNNFLIIKKEKKSSQKFQLLVLHQKLKMK